ncbi:MAG: oligosaccharide flippase family protein [Candidatus Binatia bacterium]
MRKSGADHSPCRRRRSIPSRQKFLLDPLSSVPARPSLGRNLAVLAGGEVMARVLTFVSFVHVARALEPATFGLVEVTLATVMFLTIAAEHGVAELGAREVARGAVGIEALARRIVSGQLFAAAGLYAVLATAVLVLPLDATLRRLLLGYGLSVLGLPFLLAWVFQGRNQMARVAVLQVLRAAIFTAAVLLAVHAPVHVLRLPLVEVGAVAVTAAASVWWLRRSGEHVRVGLHAALDAQTFRDSLPIGGSKLLWACRMYLPIIILASCVGSAEVGRFGAAHRILLVGQTVLGVYFTAVFPTISRLAYDSIDDLARFLQGSLRLALWPAVALALTVTWGAPMLLQVLFGSQYIRGEATGTLAVLIWIVPILAWRRHGRSALIALDRQREELWCSLGGMALLVGLAVVLSYAYGMLGAAWAMVVSEFVATLLTWGRLRRRIPSLRWLHELWGLPPLAMLTGRGDPYARGVR